jgi:hypothetical protein
MTRASSSTRVRTRPDDPRASSVVDTNFTATGRCSLGSNASYTTPLAPTPAVPTML